MYFEIEIYTDKKLNFKILATKFLTHVEVFQKTSKLIDTLGMMTDTAARLE